MKRLISIFLCLMLAFVTTAQTLSITNFVELNDLDARVYEPILDQNGKKCAILKIVTTAQGFTFDVGALGVRKTVQKTAEIWVYVPDGTRKIKIAHPQLGQLGTEDGYYWFPQAVREATCYRLTLVSGKTKIVVEEEELETGYLIIRSIPDNANVYITENGRETYAGQTPFQKKMVHGTYNFRVAKNLYYDDHGRAEIKSDRVEYTCNLSPKFGTLQLTSVPSGARVVLEGIDKEYTTPCTIERIPSGEHSLTLFKDKYNPTNQTVKIEDNKTTTLEIPLQANFAAVTINTLPEAIIRINSIQVGKGTSNGTFFTELTDGVYTIEASLHRYQTVTEQIQVVGNAPKTIELKPTAIQGTLHIMSEPMDAHIFLDGIDYGVTPQTISLPIGDYRLRLTKEGSADITKPITIIEGQTTTISETLQEEGQNITCTANGVNFEMVYVEGGTFMMGATNEQGNDVYANEMPAHEVTLSDYYIGQYEVTQELWQAVMGGNPSATKGEGLPVESVNWDDCQTFIKKLNKICRQNGTLPAGKKFYLPTEAQWEYAARGGKKCKKYRYSGSNNVEDVAWYQNNANDNLHIVGTQTPNELGIYDMSGNVFEWCSDWYGIYEKYSQPNPQGSAIQAYKVYRGGCWYNDARSCRVSYRNAQTLKSRNRGLGLRLAIY